MICVGERGPGEFGDFVRDRVDVGAVANRALADIGYTAEAPRRGELAARGLVLRGTGGYGCRRGQDLRPALASYSPSRGRARGDLTRRRGTRLGDQLAKRDILHKFARHDSSWKTGERLNVTSSRHRRMVYISPCLYSVQ